MKIYDHYLFDADGTLFDTKDLIFNCFQHVAGEFTDRLLDKQAVINDIGLPLRDMLISHLGADLNYDRILDEYLRYQLTIMEDSVKPFPHVESTLKLLKESGKKLAVVTSRRRYSLDIILESTNTAQYFDILVTPEDTVKHKPDAEPALKAIELLGADKHRCVFTGDALFDICSGSSAGIDTIFVNWSHVALSSLPVPPTWAIDSMQELTAPLA